MTTPDRFEKMKQTAGWKDQNTQQRVMLVSSAVQILRAQHTAMVRQARRMLTRHSEPDDACDYTNGYCQACDDFLAWLQGRRDE